jgi:predicted RNA-binding protein (virulence factor B family)
MRYWRGEERYSTYRFQVRTKRITNEGVGWIDLVQSKDKLGAFVNKVMKHEFPNIVGKLLTR